MGFCRAACGLCRLLFSGVLSRHTTFGTDTLRLFNAGTPLLALANIGAQLGLGLGAVWLGRSAAAWLLS